MNKTLPTSLVLAASLFVTITATAQVVVTPPDLFEGEEYRLFFTTSVGRNAMSSDIEDYNEFVVSVAESSPKLAALDVDWTAVASTSEFNARENTGTDPLVNVGVPIYRVDGVRLVDDYAQLWAFDMSRFVAPSVNEFGLSLDLATAENRLVWTGSGSEGDSGLEEAMGNRVVLVGDASGPGTDMYVTTIRRSDAELPLYAISGIIVAVPEPSTMSLSVYALAYLATALRKPSSNQ